MNVRILVDTNVLLRAIRRGDPANRIARNSLKRLHRDSYALCVTPQNVRELWNVCTRPTDYNGLGMSLAATEKQVKLLERFFSILPDSEITYQAWRILVARYEVRGKQVHDAYLVAAMSAHALKQILTFDSDDFMRYREIEAIHPASL